MADKRYYKIQVKRELRDALRDTLAAHPDPEVRKAQVHVQYPNVEADYPAIYIQYAEGMIRNTGVGHIEIDDERRPFKRWEFSGTVAFTAISRISAYDRDVLSGAVLDIIAFSDMSSWSKQFYEDLHDEDFIRMNLMHEEVTSGGENVMPAPWTDEQQLYTGTYQVAIYGEFFSDRETGDLIEISRIDLYPYLPNEPVPQGSQDPADIDIPWL